MAHPSPGTHRLREYLLTVKPGIVKSANSLAKQFGIEQTTAIRVLSKAGYVKSDDSPCWTLTNLSPTVTHSLTLSEEDRVYLANMAQERGLLKDKTPNEIKAMAGMLLAAAWESEIILPHCKLTRQGFVRR